MIITYQQQREFRKLQGDLTLTDVRVQWLDTQVNLWNGQELLITLNTDQVIPKIILWCLGICEQRYLRAAIAVLQGCERFFDLGRKR